MRGSTRVAGRESAFGVKEGKKGRCVGPSSALASAQSKQLTCTCARRTARL